jgi:hypothetical protein
MSSSVVFPSAKWLDNSSNSNVLRASYVNGVLDVSNEAIFRTDASLCGNVGINGAVSIANSIGMSGVINQLISAPLQGGYVYQQVATTDALNAIAQVAILNSLVIAGNATASPPLVPYCNPTSGNVVTLGTSTVNTILGGLNNYVTGNLVAIKDVSLNGRLVVASDVSMNARLFVVSDTSMNARLFVGQDASINGLSIGLGAQQLATNTVIGRSVLQQVNNPTSTNNAALGYQALFASTNPINDTAIGSMALSSNTTGSNNTAVGYGAGAFVTTGGNITCVGSQTGFASSATQYSKSTAIGYGATISLNNQIVLGTAAESTVVPGNVAVGSAALPAYTLDVTGTGRFTSDVSINGNLLVKGALNVQQLQNQNIINTTTTNYQLIVSEDISLNGRVYISGDASMGGKLFVTGDTSMNGRLFLAKDASINGISVGLGGGSSVLNTCFGNTALQANTTGTRNTAIGSLALQLNTTGNNNTAVGQNALAAVSGNNNVAVGQGALSVNTGASNTACGQASLTANTSGNANTAVGLAALTTNSTGSSNVAVGNNALQLTTSSFNTAVGLYALRYNTTAQNNTALGVNAGQNNGTSGASAQNNTFLGANTDIDVATNAWSNSTAIGVSAKITASNQITLGTAAEAVYVPGKLSIGKTSPGYQLDVSGTIMASGYNPKNIALATSAVPTVGASLMVDATAGAFTNQLGTTAGNYLPIISESHVNGNSAWLNTYAYRWANGGDWFSASTRIGQVIDVTNQAYIEFNPPAQTYGLGLYTGGNGGVLTPASYSGLTIANGGNTGFNNPQPVYRLDVNGTSRLNNSLTFTGAVTGTISPNTTGATSSTWAVGGVTYVASASSSTASPYFAFDTVYTVNNKWIGGGGTNPNYIYSATTGLATSFAATTVVVGQTDICGEWIQIQNSPQLVLNNYNIVCSDVTARSPKSFWIVGSNDGGTFFPIQYCTIASNPYTANTALAGTFVAGTTGTQNGYTTTAYPSYSANAYYYHRMLITATFNDNIAPGSVALGEWIINYNKPSTVTLALDGTTSGQLNISGDALVTGNVINTSGSASNTYMNVYGKAPPTNVYGNLVVSPNTTNATSATWNNNNITWTSSASTVQQSGGPYSSNLAFNTTYSTSDKWETALNTYNNPSNSGLANSTAALTSNIFGQSAQRGEWLQIQSSVPVVMTSYSLASADIPARLPKTFWIVGSNDGNNWYQIQAASCGATQYSSTVNTMSSTFLVNSASAQTSGSATLTTTINAPYTTSAFTYFRLICLSIFSTTEGLVDIGEWTTKFSVPTVTGPSRAVLYMDASNINQMDVSGSLAIINSNPSTMTVIPNTTAATNYTWQNNNITWLASASSFYTTNHLSYLAFNATYTPNPFAVANNTYTSGTGAYAGSISTAVSGQSSQTGEWLQIQSSTPLIMKNYQFGVGNVQGQLPKTYWIVGSNDGLTWYPIQSASAAAATTTASNTLVPSVITVNSTSTQTFGSTTITTTAYGTTTNSYTYFRLIGNSVTIGGATMEIGEWLINFSPVTSSVSMALDNGFPNQLNVGGALSVAGAMNVAGTLTSFASFTTTNTYVNAASVVTLSLSTLSNNGNFIVSNNNTINVPVPGYYLVNLTASLIAQGAVGGGQYSRLGLYINGSQSSNPFGCSDVTWIGNSGERKPLMVAGIFNFTNNPAITITLNGGGAGTILIDLATFSFIKL